MDTFFQAIGLVASALFGCFFVFLLVFFAENHSVSKLEYQCTSFNVESQVCDKYERKKK